MSKEKILNKKFEKINELKTKLVSRSEETKEEIVKELKETMEDLEIILEDFGYMKDSENREDEGDIKEVVEEQYRKKNIIGLEELKSYNGEDGKKAYIAVNGVVYDVTNNPYWKNGKHFGVQAGVDATSEFLQCHANGMQILDQLSVIGSLAE